MTNMTLPKLAALIIAAMSPLAIAFACQGQASLPPSPSPSPTVTPQLLSVIATPTPTPTNTPVLPPTPTPLPTATPTPLPTATPTATPTRTPPTPAPASTAGPGTPTPTPWWTSAPSPSIPSGPGARRSTGTFRPGECPQWIDEIIKDAAAKYNLPRWFYYAMIQRESSFNPNADNGRDYGLAQLGGPWYTGQPYPENLNAPEDFNENYIDSMYFARHGYWIQMSRVSRLDDPFDPVQNLDRFSTGYAVPAFYHFKKYYGLSDTETLRALAFHWNKGVWIDYNPRDTTYLDSTYGYDRWVRDFRASVEAEDGVWNGRPVLP